MDSENEKETNEIPFCKKGRGAAMLKSVVKISNDEERFKIIYNSRGQPIGEHKKLLAGYIGLLVKSWVPITCKTWHKVPDITKKNLWAAIQVKFDVDRNTKKAVLSSMSISWRGFKTNLTRDYVNKLKDKPELLKQVPSKYAKFIDQSTWDEFVKDRLSENFKNLSNDQRERRAKNIYNHRMSKKGYTGLATELGDTYQDDRSLLWTKGREKKDVGYGDDGTKEIADKVVGLRKQVEDGSVVIEGNSDILSMALGTSEHSGRVRGIGFGVTPSMYFKLPRRGSKKYMNELESKLKEEQQMRMEEQKSRIKVEQALSQLQNQVKLSNDSTNGHSSEKVALNTRISNGHSNDLINGHTSQMGIRGTSCDSKSKLNGSKLKTSRKSKAHEVVSPPISSIGKGKNCKLAISTKNNIIAEGILFERSGPNEKIHNIHLGEHNVRVSITKAISPTAALPIPVDGEMNIIKEAIGSVVAWPRDFVIVCFEEQNNDGAGHRESRKNDDCGDKEKKMKNDDGEFGIVNTFSQMLTTMDTNQISIPIEKEMFGDDTTECFVFKKDLIDLCAMAPLDVTCIKAYMRLLYEKFESTRKTIKFFNSESFNAASYQGKRRIIKERLENATRNQIGFSRIVFPKLDFLWMIVF